MKLKAYLPLQISKPESDSVGWLMQKSIVPNYHPVGSIVLVESNS